MGTRQWFVTSIALVDEKSSFIEWTKLKIGNNEQRTTFGLTMSGSLCMNNNNDQIETSTTNHCLYIKMNEWLNFWNVNDFPNFFLFFFSMKNDDTKISTSYLQWPISLNTLDFAYYVLSSIDNFNAHDDTPFVTQIENSFYFIRKIKKGKS